MSEKFLRGPCIEWTGKRISKQGYGAFYFAGKAHYAHRLVWAVLRGEIPPKMEIMHKCDNPPCVNPNHLEMGTHAENMRDAGRRGLIVYYTDRKRAFCSKGHPLSGSNLGFKKSRGGRLNGRHCRECRIAAIRAWHKRRKEAALDGPRSQSSQ